MELKKHFKLYKSGKLWCTVAVVLAGTILGVGSVQADSTLDNSNVEVQQSVTETQTNTSNENVTDNTESTSNSTVGNDNKGAVPVTPAAQSTDTSEQNIAETGQPNSFKTVNNKVYYYGNDGKEYKNQFYNNWGHTYYFGADGARYTNQFYTNWGRTYYFGADGARWDDKFMNAWGNVYYFGQDGARWDNQWMNRWGNSYYFFGDGVRATSQLATIGDATYLFDDQGRMQRDYFLNQNGKLYYFGKDGKQYKNQFYNNWGHTYYFGADGARYTNQFYNNWGRTYYFGADGARWDNQWMTNAKGQKFYFTNDGSRAESKFLGIDGNTYVFDANGVATSWGKVYYDDPTTKKVATGWRTINGNRYYFSDGYDVQRDPDDLWVYNDQLHGQMYTGIQWVDGHCYNFGTDGIARALPQNDGWSWPFPQSGEGWHYQGQKFGYTSNIRKNGFHDGLDFGTQDHPGPEVHAVHGGRVLDVNTVKDDDGKVLWWFTTVWDGKYLYVYQEAFSNRDKITVKPNDIIYAGQVIGYRDLDHLHLGINTSPNYGIDLKNSFVPSWNDPSQATGHGEWLDPQTVIRNHG